jgi:phosphopantetheinyl transferase (holo-ACP synthase)
MGITSLTWNFKSVHALIGLGIDSENIRRFDRILNKDNIPANSISGPHPKKTHKEIRQNPFPLLFTEREVHHNYSLADPSEAFCACFCFKEALFKALGGDYDYLGCELLFDPGIKRQKMRFRSSFLDRYGVAQTRGFCWKVNDEERTFVLFLFGKRLEG